VKHHFIHLSHHSSVHSSGHPFVPSWSVYSDGAEKEWNTDADLSHAAAVNFLMLFLNNDFKLTKWLTLHGGPVMCRWLNHADSTEI